MWLRCGWLGVLPVEHSFHQDIGGRSPADGANLEELVVFRVIAVVADTTRRAQQHGRGNSDDVTVTSVTTCPVQHTALPTHPAGGGDRTGTPFLRGAIRVDVFVVQWRDVLIPFVGHHIHRGTVVRRSKEIACGETYPKVFSHMEVLPASLTEHDREGGHVSEAVVGAASAC